MNIIIISLIESNVSLHGLENKSCSGTVYSYLLLAKGLAELGNDVIIYSKAPSSIEDNIYFKHIDSLEDVVLSLSVEKNIDVLIGVSHASNIFELIDYPSTIKIMWWHNTYTSNFDKYVNLLIEKRINYIIGVSDFQIGINGGYLLKKALKSKSNILSKIYNIPNPIFTELFNKTKSTPNGKNVDEISLAFVGNPAKHQGFHHVLRVFSKFRKLGYNATLKVFGSGSLHGSNVEVFENYKKEYLNDYLYDDYGEERKDIVFLGSMGRQDFYKEIYKCEAIIGGLQGIESFSVSLAEAQGLGVPVVTRIKGGQNEFVKNIETGFVTVNNDQDILDSLHSIAKMSEYERSIMSINARKGIHRFDYTLVSKKWNRILSYLLVKERLPFFTLIKNIYIIISERIRIRKDMN